ncbi:MAG: hypothetical protein JWM37_196 [Candidatus Saccharibacteria bacterium]|nr:hypothetical protein [Candidatus Saccharibacteria bacterium]
MTLATSSRLLDKFGSIRLAGQPVAINKTGTAFRVQFHVQIVNRAAREVLDQVINSMATFIQEGTLYTDDGVLSIHLDTSRLIGDAKCMDEVSNETLSKIYQFVHKTIKLFIDALDELANEVLEIGPPDKCASSNSNNNRRQQTRPRSGPQALTSRR